MSGWVDLLSPNFDLRPVGGSIDILLLHYTGMESAQAAIDRLRSPLAKVSAHYLVDEDGSVYRLVGEDKRAWHAGVSRWAGEADINARSIGVELVNPGHEFGYRAFPDPQMMALVALARGIVERHSIPAARVLGHSDVAPLRKADPGELFDWKRLAGAGIGLWPKAKMGDWNSAGFTRDLARFGYDVEGPEGADAAAARKAATIAFCRHFRPSLLASEPDQELASILAGLIDAADLTS
jgi:N-acetylmuramoyl-L-alanine amidase